jgi:tRNA modification GTPase
VPVTRVHTKIDLSGLPPRVDAERGELWLSAKTGAGLDLLRQHLLALAGFSGGTAGSWSARQRHVDALTRTRRELDAALLHLADRQGELAAEALRLGQEALAEITGRVSSDELLGRIFGSFCIGK